MGWVFYEDGFSILEDAGGEVKWEGVDDGDGRGGRVMYFHYFTKGVKKYFILTSSCFSNKSINFLASKKSTS